MSGRRDDPEAERRPQLAMWDDERRETPIGTLEAEGVEWQLKVVLEPASGGLFRGRLSFRHGEDRYDTAPVLVEDTADAVVERATLLPRSMLVQFLLSARG